VNTLDWVVLAIAAAFAIFGFRQGFLVGICATVGLFGGGALGVLAAPSALERFEPSFALAGVAVITVLFLASLGQAAGAVVGWSLRRRITWQPVSALDAIGGSALNAAAVLVIAWALGVAVSGAGLAGVGDQVRSSTVLASIDRALPGRADQLLRAFQDVVDSDSFPRYLQPFVPERIRPVRPPSARTPRDPDVVRAGRSVVKVLASSVVCGRSAAGSGFVYAPGRVMTNAHVVSGVTAPVVELAGQRYDADTVVYDPGLDLAVLFVPGLPGAPLSFDRSARDGQPAVVLGFPENGPFNAEPARIRDQQRLRSPDIYNRGTVVRDVYSVFAEVRPGNSGGPLVSRAGDVLGVVFAASVTDAQTGYAISADQAAGAAAEGRTARQEVGTGDCS
jgi:S1-C subfamily serine protease